MQQIDFFDPKTKAFFFRIPIFGGVDELRTVRSRQHDDGTYMAILSNEKNEKIAIFHFLNMCVKCKC